MKIVLTKNEVKAMVAHRFGSKVDDFTLVISEPSIRKPTMLDELVGRLEKLDVFVSEHKNVIKSDKLITAIKELRQFYADKGFTILLADAKTAIEEWPLFYPYCKKNGLPAIHELEVRSWRI